MANILIVEDEPRMRRLLEISLGEDGHSVHSAEDAEKGLAHLRKGLVDLVVTDLKLPGMNGLEFLQEGKRLDAPLPFIVMTAYGSVETAVDAMKAGASDYVLKPFTMAEMKLVITKELDVQQVWDENRSLKEALGKRYHFQNIVGRSKKMQEVLALVERVAPTNSTVLIGGESGVGKDLIARAIHEHSQRAAGPFVKINSTAIPETLLESELFGYEKGAFSGAAGSKQGEFERLGGTKTHKVDVRLVAATNRDLRAALEEGTFREDLYYRLNVVAIDIPPLRDHKEDIPALANYFLERYARETAKPVTGITPEAMKRLMDYHWPGNVRELQNIIERGVTLSAAPSSAAATGTVLDVADIYLDDPAARSASSSAHVLPPGMTLEQWEDETIREALRRANGNKSQAARALGLSRNALRYRLSKLGVADPTEE